MVGHETIKNLFVVLKESYKKLMLGYQQKDNIPKLILKGLGYK